GTHPAAVAVGPRRAATPARRRTLDHGWSRHRRYRGWAAGCAAVGGAPRRNPFAAPRPGRSPERYRCAGPRPGTARSTRHGHARTSRYERPPRRLRLDIVSTRNPTTPLWWGAIVLRLITLVFACGALMVQFDNYERPLLGT